MTTWTDDEVGGSVWSEDEAAGTALGAATGSSLVGFVQSGIGALTMASRTAQDKMREVKTSADISGASPVGIVGVGPGVFSALTTGANNTAVGGEALQANTTGYANTAVGYQALKANTIGGNPTDGGNTAIGAAAMISNTTGSNNTAVGLDALFTNEVGYSNTAIGSNALGFGKDGYESVAVGFRALFNGGAAHHNTAVGVRSLNANLTGNGNVALGHFAGAYELGSNAFYVDNQDRTDTAGDKAKALLYGTFAALASGQTLKVNGTLTSVYAFTANDCYLGNSGTQDYLQVFGQASASGPLLISINSAGNAYRPLTVYGSTFVWSYAGGQPVITASQQGLMANCGLQRGIITTTDAAYTVLITDTHIIANRAGTVTLTLPAAASFTGRELTVRTIQAQTVVSASSNVVPLAGGAAGTAILSGTAGRWACLVSDGTNWQIQMGVT